MKKFLLVLLSILFIVSGMYGFHYFTRLGRAKTELGQAMLLVNGERYGEAIEALEDIIAAYPYAIVKAPALYLLADIYERQGQFEAAFEAHRILITHKEIPATNDWLILSIISVSKLYRNNVLPLSRGDDTALERYIDTIRNAIDLKQEQVSVSPLFHWDESPFISLQDNLVSLKLDKGEVLKYLKTELAFLYVKAGRYTDAAVIFQEINTNAARFGMAQIYFEKGNYQSGIDILKELTAHDTTGKISVLYLDRMYTYAEMLYEKKCQSEAIEIYKKIISLDHNSLYAEYSSYKLATHYFSSCETRNALMYVDSTLSNSPTLKDEDAYLLKGYIYYDSRDYYRALKVFDDFPKRFPHSNRLRTAKEWKAMSERSIKYLS